MSQNHHFDSYELNWKHLKVDFVNSWFFKRYNNISTFRSSILFKYITVFRIRDFISLSINVKVFRIRDFIFCSSFKYKFFLFLNRKSVRSSKQININFWIFEFFFSTMNDDRIFFKIIMLIFNSNNFHFWIEKFKDLTLKIKIWEYINSYNQITKSRKEILFEIFYYAVKTSFFASSTTADDFITDQINQSAQNFTQSRFAKYFHELSTQQQEICRANVKEYKRKKKQIVKFTQRMLKINEVIRVLIRFYISSKLMFAFIKKILQFYIIKYKKIDDQIKKQIHEKFQTLK